MQLDIPQHQYFPANAERMAVHCLESGCIGKYILLGPRKFRSSEDFATLGPRAIFQVQVFQKHKAVTKI